VLKYYIFRDIKINKTNTLKTKSIELLAELNGQIEFLESEFDNEILKAEEVIRIILKTLDNLKKIVTKHRFKSKNEEINFFKTIKPQFTSKLYYYNAVFRMASHKPIGSTFIIKSFYQSEQEKIKLFFDENLDFYKYYRTNSSYLDEKYFLRGNYDFKVNLDHYFFELDPKFSTSHDYKIAMIMAYDLLSIYIDKKILETEKINTLQSQRNHNSKLKWTGSKVALIELIYALQTEGVFNNGASDLKDIAEYFQEIFNVELGQYRRTFLEIRTRKEDRAKFISSLRDKLIFRMDESDENFY